MNHHENSTLGLVRGWPAPVWGLVALSVAAGLAYPMIDGRFGPGVDMAAKGLCVGALAVSALVGNYRWLAAILAAGTLGDVLLEVPGGLIAGGAAFAAGHAIAIVYYLRNRRPALSGGDWRTAAALVLYGALMPTLVLRSFDAAMTVYALLLGAMAAAALVSRFPRQWAAMGAVLFIVSDTLLIMRTGGRYVAAPAVHGLMVWYFYYLGQLGIFIGVARK